jgi:peptidoglycan-N-acetylglucosamine deacetylase
MMHRTPFFLPLLYPGLCWRMPADKHELYLTFDDGPVPGPTEFVLHELGKRSVKATFFCIGDNVRKHSSVFREIVGEGHAIGNHTYNHVKGWQTKLHEYIDNINRCDDELRAHDPSIKSHLFRPPYGRITRSQIKALSDKQLVMWDVLTRDYDASLAAEKCLAGTLNAIRNGSIIVFHDSVKAQKNLEYVLPRFMDACLEKGYTFKVLA